MSRRSASSPSCRESGRPWTPSARSSSSARVSRRACGTCGSLSLVVHGVVAVMLLMMPTPSLEDDSLKNVMTISLGGATGVRNGGATNMSGRDRGGGRLTLSQASAGAGGGARPGDGAADEEGAAEADAVQGADRCAGETRRRKRSRRRKAMRGSRRVRAGWASGSRPAAAGRAGTSNVSNFCCPDYLATMVQLIQRNWNGQQNVAGRTRIKFTIQRDGRLTDIQLEQSRAATSRSTRTRSARILMTRQLPPLPAQFPDQTLTVHLNFDTCADASNIHSLPDHCRTRDCNRRGVARGHAATGDAAADRRVHDLRATGGCRRSTRCRTSSRCPTTRRFRPRRRRWARCCGTTSTSSASST